MRNSKGCNIENTVMALEQAIESKKKQMSRAQNPSTAVPVGISQAFSEVLSKAGDSHGPISIALQQVGEFAQNFIKKTQENVEERPWEALRQVAVSSFGIGLFLSLRHRKSTRGEK